MGIVFIDLGFCQTKVEAPGSGKVLQGPIPCGLIVDNQPCRAWKGVGCLVKMTGGFGYMPSPAAEADPVITKTGVLVK